MTDERPLLAIKIMGAFNPSLFPVSASACRNAEEGPTGAVWHASDRARVDGINEPVDLNVWRDAGTTP